MIYDEHQYFDKAKQLSYIDIYIYNKSIRT